MSEMSTEKLQSLLTNTMVALVSREEPDLTARQMAVLLTCVSSDKPQTVRGLAAQLKVAKPVITRAVDKLEELNLLQRKPDISDRRSVLVATTRQGVKHVKAIADIMFETNQAIVAEEGGMQMAA